MRLDPVTAFVVISLGFVAVMLAGDRVLAEIERWRNRHRKERMRWKE